MQEVIRENIPHIILTVSVFIGLTFMVISSPYIREKHRRTMQIIIVICAVLIAQSCVESLLSYGPPSVVMPRTIISVLGYALRPVVIVMFLYVINPEKGYRGAWTLVAVNTAVHMTTFFSRICFWIDENNHFQRGPLAHFGLWVSVVLLAYYIYLTYRTFSSVSKREMFVPVINVLLIVLSTLMDYEDGSDRMIPYLTISIVITSLFSYIWLHLRFAEEHVADIEAQQRLNIMMSQMQPHFLFNTLATIQGLCLENPQEASKITGRFGKYLRQNLDSLEHGTRIAFDKELEHTMNYAEIEMVRFPNIRIETDIQDRDFTLPALSVQPMVENAIRHGVRIRDEGIIRISSRKAGDYHEIVISDNGKGFDTSAVEAQEGLHLGIRNVRERIERMCGGSLDIDSRIGEGTMVTIRIPEGGTGK